MDSIPRARAALDAVLALYTADDEAAARGGAAGESSPADEAAEDAAGAPVVKVWTLFGVSLLRFIWWLFLNDALYEGYNF